MKFNKKPTSLEEQVALLKSRGVTILQKYLGRFEIMFRSVLNYVLVTETQNPFWFLDEELFTNSIDLSNLNQECVDALERAIDNNELSAVHFKAAYTESDVPPCWILSEYLSFGKWSKVFGALKYQSHVKKVATAAFNELILACPEDFENALGLPKGFNF